MSNLITRAGSAKTHYFEETDSLVYNLKLYAKELKCAPLQNGYKNFGLMQEDDKLAVYSFVDIQNSDDLKKKGTPILSFSIPEEKISKLTDSNGYIDLVAAPNRKEEIQEKYPDRNAFVIYQKQAAPGEPENKKNFLCGLAYNFKELFLGNAFKNLVQGNEYLNIVLNKTRLLASTPPNKSVYISLTPSPKSDSFLVNLSPETPKVHKDYIFKLDMNIINTCETDKNGNLNLSASMKKEKSILQDGADMNIWDNSHYIKFRENPQEKMFVGKGFSVSAQSVFLDKSNQHNFSTGQNNDQLIAQDSFVNFQVENDYHLNKTFGVGSYQVCGKVAEISQNNVVINSSAGNFSIALDKVQPTSQKDFDTFNVFYDNLKEIGRLRQKEAIQNISSEKKNNGKKPGPKGKSVSGSNKVDSSKKSSVTAAKKPVKSKGPNKKDIDLSL